MDRVADGKKVFSMLRKRADRHEQNVRDKQRNKSKVMTELKMEKTYNYADRKTTGLKIPDTETWTLRPPLQADLGKVEYE